MELAGFVNGPASSFYIHTHSHPGGTTMTDIELVRGLTALLAKEEASVATAEVVTADVV